MRAAEFHQGSQFTELAATSGYAVQHLLQYSFETEAPNLRDYKWSCL